VEQLGEKEASGSDGRKAEDEEMKAEQKEGVPERWSVK
jgi:hypothetical protein